MNAQSHERRRPQETLVMKRVLRSAIERVFDALSRSDVLASWFVCTPGWTADVTNDLRVGGQYRIVMRDSDRNVTATIEGEYLRIEHPHHLSFTWNSAGRTVQVKKSIVTIDLRSVSKTDTELVLVHDLDPTSDEGRAHASGWERTLTSLQRNLEEER